MNKKNQQNKKINKNNFETKTTIFNKKLKISQSSKSLEKNDLDNNKNNKFKNKSKLRQNNSIHNFNYNGSKIRGKSKSSPNSKSNKLFSSINNDEISNSFAFKQNIIHNNRSNDINTISEENNFKSDIGNKNIFFKTNENTLKINIKKKPQKTNIKENIKKHIINFENLKYVPLDDISSLYKYWQNSTLIFKAFENEIMKKKDFEIDEETLEIKAKNDKACEQLYNQKFWILYIEYLIYKKLFLDEKQFIFLINKAFTYIKGYQCGHLKEYFLEKIKKISPCFLPDGSLDENDEVYINKLNTNTINYINMQKRFHKGKSFDMFKNYRTFTFTDYKKEKNIFNNKIERNLNKIFEESCNDESY